MGENLAIKINELKKGRVGKLIIQRMQEFKNLAREGNREWFSELCFCVLTANSKAKLGIKIQRDIGSRGFLELSETETRKKLRRLGHRFPNTRARFIIEARKFHNIKATVKKLKDSHRAREWLQKNVKGIGWKEASHFLRNVGFENTAILDRHVLALMHEYKLIDDVPRSLTRKNYLKIEEKLSKFANELNLSLGELDLYLWYMKTGEILK